MTDKEKFDSYMRLADFRLARHKTRADVEWKISMALWALIASAPFSITGPTNLYVVGGALIIVVGLHMVLWTGQIWARNREDQQTAFFYTEHAEKLLLPNTPLREKPAQTLGLFHSSNLKPFVSLSSWGVWFQTVTSALVAAGCFWVFWQR